MKAYGRSGKVELGLRAIGYPFWIFQRRVPANGFSYLAIYHCIQWRRQQFYALSSEFDACSHDGLGGSSARWGVHLDTDVILAAIDRRGLNEAVNKIVGMFAFALWDRLQRELHLVRDRLGIKPLYYGWHGSHLLFGSELKAIKAHPAFQGDINPDAVATFLRYNFIPAPCSINKDTL